MYIPDHFKNDDLEKTFSFLEHNNFGEFITVKESKPSVTHTAFLFEPRSMRLFLHLARANPQWQDLDNKEALLVANGPHGYISPSWYQDAGVPTWNYQAVHVHGKVTVFSDLERLATLVNGLTEFSERGLEKPWQPDYPKSMLRGIVGIEIAIDDIQCKFKLSQNRSRVDQERSVEKLKHYGNHDLASAMLKENNIN
ncbi:MAG: FMN-binding negative transcriptional regulator [Pseudohongiellaceae bacterium]